MPELTTSANLSFICLVLLATILSCALIETGITSGRFRNASEVVREGLRLPEQREQDNKAKLEWLRAAANEGFDSADQWDCMTLRSDREINDFVDRMRLEVLEKFVASMMSGSPASPSEISPK